jgi:lysophospholipase L1-like esterase
VHLPGVLQRGSGADDEALIGLARQAGFATVALFDAYGDGDRKELVVAPWDAHPNAAGHAAIAEAFYRALRSQATVDLAGREVERPRPER